MPDLDQSLQNMTAEIKVQMCSEFYQISCIFRNHILISCVLHSDIRYILALVWRGSSIWVVVMGRREVGNEWKENINL